jgi:NhaP-type Na+/H+ or K+/H+ antiporter
MVLYMFMLGGFVIASVFSIGSVQNSQWYLLAVATLLAGGLYSSTYGISITEARRHVRLILKAITVGVLLKALIIGAGMALVLRSPFGFILGIIVAQIDPLSTAALMKGNRMTKRAKAILAAWASFDDPMTVILSLYAPVVGAMLTGTHWEAVHGSMQDAGLAGYFTETGVNLLFAGGVFVLWQLMKRHSKATSMVVVVLVALGMYGLLVGALSVGVYYFWMLGIAVLGLFMRPPIEKMLEHTVRWALHMAAVLLGILLVHGVNLWPGVALGFFAYSAQIIVGLLLTRKFTHKDRLHIAFAQQNGITAIILALLFETTYPGTVAIVAPAIVVINVLHVAANHAVDMHLAGDYRQLAPRRYLERLRAHINKI